jgi:hypothetical protein
MSYFKLKRYEKELLSLIYDKKIQDHKNEIMSYPEKRKKYSIAIIKLIKLELIILIDNNYFLNKEKYEKFIKQENSRLAYSQKIKNLIKHSK